VVSVAVVVPVKAFGDAKHRLAEVLGPDERAALARDLATRVVRAARGVDVFVVCDDEDVATWGKELGATVLWRPAAGLNDAATFAVAEVAAAGFAHAVIAHGDLPLAGDLTVALGFDGVTLVPDRHADGTYVLAVPTGAGFVFRYGPGSFVRHLGEAHGCGLAVRVLRDRSLSWDVDVPDDLLPTATDNPITDDPADPTTADPTTADPTDADPAGS
jgi:2-phospho-L-lactate guanylyltransferase